MKAIMVVLMLALAVNVSAASNNGNNPIKKVVVKKEKIFWWRAPGGSPFGGDAIKAIKLFSLPEEVKKIFIAQVNKGKPAEYRIKAGDTFSQMIFGKAYLVKNNVIADGWQSRGATDKADLYSVDFDGKRYLLIRPEVCNNWAWLVGDIPSSTVVKAGKGEEVLLLPTEVVKEKVPPPVVKEKEKEKETPFSLTKEREKSPVSPVLEVLVGVPTKLEISSQPRWDSDITTGVFTEDFHDGNNVSGGWGVVTAYRLNGRKNAYGLAIEYNGWGGETGDGFKYEGSRLTFGPAYRHTNSDSQTTIRVGYGIRSDSGQKTEPTGVYESEQDTNIVSAYLSHEMWRNGTCFTKTRIIVAGDFDVSHNREDSWTDAGGKQSLGTAPEDQSMVSAGVDSEILILDSKKNAIIGGGFSVIHYPRANDTGFRPEIGLYLWDRVVEVKVYYTSWKNTDSYGGTVNLNLVNLYKKFSKKEKGLSEFKEVKYTDRSKEVLNVLNGK